MKLLFFCMTMFALSLPSLGQTSEEFNYSGVEKDELQDYKGAVADYTKAIALNPKNAMAYYNRGVSKGNMHDYLGAIADYNKAIELNPRDAYSFFNRGIAKLALYQREAACQDFKKAKELGYEEVDEQIQKNCN